MSTESVPTLDEDLEALNAAFKAGRPVPADVDARLEERAQEFRQRILQERGFLNVAVPSVRKDREAGH